MQMILLYLEPLVVEIIIKFFVMGSCVLRWLENFVFKLFAIDFCLKNKDYSLYCVCSPVAQLVEQMTVNHWVTGSSPVWGAIFSSSFFIQKRILFCQICTISSVG